MLSRDMEGNEPPARQILRLKEESSAKAKPKKRKRSRTPTTKGIPSTPSTSPNLSLPPPSSSPGSGTTPALQGSSMAFPTTQPESRNPTGLGTTPTTQQGFRIPKIPSVRGTGSRGLAKAIPPASLGHLCSGPTIYVWTQHNKRFGPKVHIHPLVPPQF